MPRSLVFVTLNPSTVIQLLPEMVKPCACPLSVTLAPGAAAKTVGAVEVPEADTVTSSGYVPEATRTVWPAATTPAPAPIVQNGCAAVPGPMSEQDAFARST